MLPNSYCVQRYNVGGNGDALCLSNTFCPQIAPFKRQPHHKGAAGHAMTAQIASYGHQIAASCFDGVKNCKADDGLRLHRGTLPY
jgi:hypothetical protein